MDVNYYSLHYHMKQCGVKFVIENINEALKNFSDIRPHLIYSSDFATYEDKGIDTIDLKDIGYSDKRFTDEKELSANAEKLKEKLRSQLDLSKRCVLHTHNVNLMKNSSLGIAIESLAKELEDELLVIMQVHDFAEDNRPDRLELMNECTSKTDKSLANKIAYPINNNIIYCTINSRDKELLKKINIPEDRLYLFPNNIDSDFLRSKPKIAGLDDKLEEYAKKNSYNFSKDRKTLLSPLKIIRRKNVIESLLILNTLNHRKDEWQLLITLDAHSDEDKEHSELIKRYVRENQLPVTIGFGYEFVSPSKDRTAKTPYNMVDLFSYSDHVLTTSRLEGFGMTYLEPWVAGKAVLGRRLDFIFEDFENNGIKLDHFYGKLDIKGKDFKDYGDKEQIDILTNMDYSSLLDKKPITRIIDYIEDPHLDDMIEHNKQKILEKYSLRSYYNRLEHMIESGFELGKQKRNERFNIDNSYLVEFFNR